jgi:hypothetical protein
MGGGTSIFDKIDVNDVIIAFFPCTRFEDQILLHFRGDVYQMKNYTLDKKLMCSMKLHEELHKNYMVISKLVMIAIKNNLKLIIENPYAEQHYLKRYWCVKPKIIDMDRRENGDYFRKPTQYFFINCEPKYNFLLEALPNNRVAVKMPIRTARKEVWDAVGASDRKTARSMIHPDYANRFIRQYLID